MNELSLAELYSLNSKHSNYQVLARPLRALLPQDSLSISSRYEAERLDYVLARHTVQGKTVADIGGNTGFFTLECAAAGAARVLYFEGNAAHARFVALAAQALKLDQAVETEARYLDFRGDFPREVDVCLLLNVLHHIGDDYGDAAISREAARKNVLDSLSYMAGKARLLVFQLGFNWKGNRELPLFEQGTKAEMIDFIRQGTAADWDIVDIGIARRGPEGITYQDLNEHNLARDDSLGEFLNRPLFLMRSKHFA
jgi:SAM-dependent methyltransferase